MARNAKKHARAGWSWTTKLAVVLILLVLTAVGLALRFAHKADERWEEEDFRWDYGNMDGTAVEKTTIPTYPVGSSFRLRPTEERMHSLTPQQVYETVNPAVVTVVAMKDVAGAGIGTGVIISEDGFIITNFHVVEGGRDCGVLLSSGYTYEAKMVGYDKENDIAVLKVDETGLPAATFGSSDLLTVGDKVYAIGNPLGLELRGTLTDGIISAINRDVDVDGVVMTLIQTNAALNVGNSGGPLINEYGQVVGINTVKLITEYAVKDLEGLGFAIPSSTVAHIANCLIEDGDVHPEPVLGITVVSQTRSDGTLEALIVQSVSKGLGGEIAGVCPGDIIAFADGEEITSSTDLLRCRRRYEEGESLPLTLLRDGEYIDVLVPLMVAE